MAGDAGAPSLLILLVGTNPLPDYLSACALRPWKIALISSSQTQQIAQRLQSCLERALQPKPEFEPTLVVDAADASDIAEKIGRLIERHRRDWRICLNYTGGTKVMAAHALRVFREKGGRPADASYLHDNGPGGCPALYFDDRTKRTLGECNTPALTLATLLELHGAHLQSAPAHEPAPTPDDAFHLASRVLKEPQLAKSLYNGLKEAFGEKEDPKQALAGRFVPARYNITLSIGEFPTEEQLQSRNREQRASWFRQWRHFVGGGWLEQWVKDQAKACGVSENELACGFQVFRGTHRVQLEIDVAVVRNFRSYFVSCTTAREKAICKQKLFEIAVRSRQLAGDLARAALVCLADGNTLRELRAEVDAAQATSHALRVPGLGLVGVFGLDDLRAWAGLRGAGPNLKTLKDWLES